MFVNVFFCFPTSSPVLLALHGDDDDDDDGNDNEGSPVLLAPYVRSTSRPKKSCESGGRPCGKPKPTNPTPIDLWVYFLFPH